MNLGDGICKVIEEMGELATRYGVTKRELTKGRRLKVAAVAAPAGLTLLPLAGTFAATFLFGVTPPVAATILFLGLMLTALGFVAGAAISVFSMIRYSGWSRDMRERIAADGIRAEELDWFRGELKASERRKLKEMERGDPLIADSYRDALASKLTAKRIVRSSNQELLATRRRQGKLKQLKTANVERYAEQFASDAEKLKAINEEAKQMMIEAESRIQLIEAASARGGGIADSELALKKLSARTLELPHMLEEAKITDEVLKELENPSEPLLLPENEEQKEPR